MILHANCKINFGLDILRRREDGFHDLESVICPVVGLYDDVVIERIAESETSHFESRGLVIDCADEDNLCLRAARLMQQRYGVGGVSITLEKRVPFGAGLGGGSSDATAVILGINQLFELDLPESELISLAAELGSDTAFFVRNTPQLCSGRGEVMEPISLELDGLWIALIKPQGVNVSTGAAFSKIYPATPSTPLSERISRPMSEWQGIIKNDFEAPIFAAHPTLRTIKEELIAAGAIYASMSGSGSTIFGIFDSPEKIKGEPLESYSPYIYQL